MMNKMIKKAAIVIGAAVMVLASVTCAVGAVEYIKQGRTYAEATDDHGFKTDSNISTQKKYAVNVAKGTYLALRNDISSSDASIIDELYNGDTVTVIEGNGTFWCVSSDKDGRMGYVNSNYLVAVNDGQNQTYTGETDDHGFKADSNVAVKKQYTVNVAKGTYLALRNDLSSSDSAIIDELYNGDTVTVIEGNGTFWCVSSDKDGRMGYVNSNYLV